MNRQIAEKRQPQIVMRLDALDELAAPFGFLLKRRYFAQSLNGVDAVRVQIAKRFTRPRPQRINPAAHEKRAKDDDRQERHQRGRHLPTERNQRDQNRRRHQQGDEGRRHRMGEEKLDRLHVLRRHGNQIASATPNEVSRRKPIEFLEKRDTHFRQQPERHVMRGPGFEPMEDARRRGHDRQRNQQAVERLAPFNGRDDQRADGADADKGGHPRNT